MISPLLANVYLDALDEVWERDGQHLGRLVRYADDLVILCRTSRLRPKRHFGGIRGDPWVRFAWSLHPEKTRLVELGLGKEGFVFLGCYFQDSALPFYGKALPVSLAFPGRR